MENQNKNKIFAGYKRKKPRYVHLLNSWIYILTYIYIYIIIIMHCYLISSDQQEMNGVECFSRRKKTHNFLQSAKRICKYFNTFMTSKLQQRPSTRFSFLFPAQLDRRSILPNSSKQRDEWKTRKTGVEGDKRRGGGEEEEERPLGFVLLR